MNFLGGDRESKILISQNTLIKIVSKNYGLMLRAVKSKLQISCYVSFCGEKLEFLENFNIFVIFAYELPNRILILEKSEDFFLSFLKSFG